MHKYCIFIVYSVYICIQSSYTLIETVTLLLIDFFNKYISKLINDQVLITSIKIDYSLLSNDSTLIL